MKPEAFSMHNTRGVHDVVMYVCVCAHYAPSVTHACEVRHYTGIHACTEAQQTQLPVVTHSSFLHALFVLKDLMR